MHNFDAGIFHATFKHCQCWHSAYIRLIPESVHCHGKRNDIYVFIEHLYVFLFFSPAVHSHFTSRLKWCNSRFEVKVQTANLTLRGSTTAHCCSVCFNSKFMLAPVSHIITPFSCVLFFILFFFYIFIRCRAQFHNIESVSIFRQGRNDIEYMLRATWPVT